MKNYVQTGDSLTLTPTIAVASGTGFLFGAAIFGVAKNDVAANAPGEFQTEGVVEIAKTAALAVAPGDRVFWDPVGKAANKTVAAQQNIGVAILASSAAAVTVVVKLGQYLPVAT